MAAQNSVNGNSLVAQDLPPYAPGKAYTLKSLCGEIIYIPCSKSAMRLLVTGVETEGAFALAGTGGSQSPPIGFHFHREAHDVFLCLKGSINVWADDTCRTMGPGDLASVPPVRTARNLSRNTTDRTPGHHPSISNPWRLHRIHRSDHPRWLGGILQIYRRALRRTDVADG